MCRVYPLPLWTTALVTCVVITINPQCMLTLSCVEFIPLPLWTTALFKCVLITSNPQCMLMILCWHCWYSLVDRLFGGRVETVRLCHIKLLRTYSKWMTLERARCVEFFHISLGWFKHIEPHRTSSKWMILESEVCRVFSHKFGVVQAHRTSSNLLDIRESEVYRVFSHKFGVVQAHRTSSNLLNKPAIRESEVYRFFSHKFRVGQAHWTSSNLLRMTEIRESKPHPTPRLRRQAREPHYQILVYVFTTIALNGHWSSFPGLGTGTKYILVESHALGKQ